MASYDATMGMWKGKDGRYYSSQDEAQQADSNYLDAGDFFMGSGGITAKAPDAPAPTQGPGDQPNPQNPGGISDNELARRRKALQDNAIRTANANAAGAAAWNASGGAGQGGLGGNIQGGATGAYNAVSDASRANYDYMHDLGNANTFISPRTFLNREGEAVGVTHAGDAANPNPFAGKILNPMDVLNDPGNTLLGGVVDDKRGLGTTLDTGTGTGGLPLTRAAEMQNPPGGSSAAGATGATGPAGGPPAYDNGGRASVDAETADAKQQAQATIDQNRDENSSLFANAFDQYNKLTGPDNTLSDEARGYQREGLQQQRALLQKMLGYDENQAATRYADQTLARQIALARSAPGGAASQQAGIFAAMDQAPSLYAQGAQQAAAEQTTRLGQAESAAKAFGDLGTMTRGQDVQQAQFEASLQKGIADSVSQLTQGQVQMNQQDSQEMASIWMDFAKLQSVYAGMSSAEQLAWWQNETAQRGQDKNFQAILAQLNAQGKVTPKDIIGGLFQLGGGAISAGGSIGGAIVAGNTARDVASINAGGGGVAPVAPVTAPGGASPVPTSGTTAMGDYNNPYTNYV